MCYPSEIVLDVTVLSKLWETYGSDIDTASSLLPVQIYNPNNKSKIPIINVWSSIRYATSMVPTNNRQEEKKKDRQCEGLLRYSLRCALSAGSLLSRTLLRAATALSTSWMTILMASPISTDCWRTAGVARVGWGGEEAPPSTGTRFTSAEISGLGKIYRIN